MFPSTADENAAIGLATAMLDGELLQKHKTGSEITLARECLCSYEDSQKGCVHDLFSKLVVKCIKVLRENVAYLRYLRLCFAQGPSSLEATHQFNLDVSICTRLGPSLEALPPRRRLCLFEAAYAEVSAFAVIS